MRNPKRMMAATVLICEALLVFFATTWWVAMPLAFSLALSMAAIGFNVQHDGAHGDLPRPRGAERRADAGQDVGQAPGAVGRHLQVGGERAGRGGHGRVASRCNPAATSR